MRVVGDAGDVARLAARQLLAAIWNAASGDVQRANMSPQPQASAISWKMWKSASASPGARATFLMQADAPLRVDERPFLLAPAGRRQDEVRRAARSRWSCTCPARRGSRAAPSMSRASAWLIHECAVFVATTHRPLILPAQDALDDLVVGPAVLASGCAPRRCPGRRRPSSRCSGVGEVVAAEQVGRVAEQPRAHRVALAGDRVRAGARPADVAGQQREVDDRLRECARPRGSG